MKDAVSSNTTVRMIYFSISIHACLLSQHICSTVTTTYLANHFSYNTYWQDFGVKGPLWLCTIPAYNMINRMSINYMHRILLRIRRLLLRLWIQACHHFELWYIGDQITTIDDRPCSITPPKDTSKHRINSKILER